MSKIKSFTIGEVTYNAAMASAVQQDEALSIMTQPLVQRLVEAGKQGVQADESVLLPMVMAMPYSMKQKFDGLLMSRISIHGRDDFISAADFDGKVMALNQLRVQVMRWNLEGFFIYWASERNAEEAAE